MQTLFTFVSPPDQCGYLPDQRWQLRYEVVGELTPAEYAARMRVGWRRFGKSLFKPECPECRQCRSIRVNVNRFRPSESQRRVRRRNESEVRVEVETPTVTDEKLALYDKYHQFQAAVKGWPEHGCESATDYLESFVENPFVTQEWNYFIGDRLVGVGYVDRLPVGLSAIYFYYDPDERSRSLGTWNVLSVIAGAAAAELPHVYLGYFVAGCRSLEYKAKYRPNEILEVGKWRPFVG
ncbi:MAG TPA: arginyltransferase [Fimbriiglobus sp.]|jgi:arginine-tRNA-protein transferase|nr:arginyltransferase [Fimbriiglobus sp.]